MENKLSTAYSKLPPEERCCYQQAVADTKDTLTVYGHGCFALLPYDESHWREIRRACGAWKFKICHSEGIDQDHDSGIYDVDRTYWDEDILPSQCILEDGKVIGFVHPKGGFFIIDSVTYRNYDANRYSTVNETSYRLVEK